MKRLLTVMGAFGVAAVMVGCGGGSMENVSDPTATEATGDVTKDLESAGVSEEDYMKAMQEERKKSK